MIVLHQFPRKFGLANLSPFCAKVETYLRLAGLDHEIARIGNPSKGPKGKAPWITDGDRTIADSAFIVRYLKDTYGDPLGEGLSALDRARHHALARLLEERLNVIIGAERWLEVDGGAVMRRSFFGSLPGPVRKLAFALVQRRIRNAGLAQGMLRHSRPERMELAQTDIDALATYLGDAPFFGGEAPREIDCVTYPYAAGLLCEAFDTPLRNMALAHENLVAYAARMKARVFPEI